MGEYSLPVGIAPRVIVEEIYGSLDIKGWERDEVRMQTPADEAAVFQLEGETLHVRVQGACSLRLPMDAMLRVSNVHGGVRARSLHGRLEIQRVLGSLLLQDVAEAQVEVVFGDLSARSIRTDLTVRQVLGNAHLYDVQGRCTLERVAGNLILRKLDGELSAAVGGNAHLRLSSLTGQNNLVTAGGNISIYFPPEASVSASLSSGVEEITIVLPGGKEVYRQKTHQVTLGNGQARIDLVAGGMLALVSQMIAWDDEWGASQAAADETTPGISEDLSQSISQRIEAQMKILDEQMSRLSEVISRAGIPQAEAEEILQRARRSSEHASQRAEEKIRRAREKLEQKLADVQRKVERKSARRRRTWGFVWPPSSPVQADSSSAAQVSDEERLIILRMLEQKKITLEEAEKLLAALEGDE